MRENSLQQLEEKKNEIAKTRMRIRQLKKELDCLSNEITIEQSQHDALSKEVSRMRADLGENREKIQEIEKQFPRLNQKFITLRGDYARSKATSRVLLHRLKDLSTRKDRFESTHNEFKKSLMDLNEVRREQKERLKSLQQTLDRRIVQKQILDKEITEAVQL